MQTFIVDDWKGRGTGNGPGPSRIWSELTGRFVKCRWDPATWQLTADEQCDWSTGLVVVHRSFFIRRFCNVRTEDAQRDVFVHTLSRAAEAYSDLIWIVISGDRQLDKSTHNRLYFRRTKLNDPLDPGFRRYFAEFRSAVLALHPGDPLDFSLLEPEPISAALLQVHSALGTQGPMPQLAGEIWEGAKSAFCRLANRGYGQGPLKEDSVICLSAARWPEELLEMERASVLRAFDLVLRRLSEGRRPAGSSPGAIG